MHLSFNHFLKEIPKSSNYIQLSHSFKWTWKRQSWHKIERYYPCITIQGIRNTYFWKEEQLIVHFFFGSNCVRSAFLIANSLIKSFSGFTGFYPWNRQTSGEQQPNVSIWTSCMLWYLQHFFLHLRLLYWVILHILQCWVKKQAHREKTPNIKLSTMSWQNFNNIYFKDYSIISLSW